MRDYLYIWNDRVQKLLVASGIEFRDLLPLFTMGGVVLLKHAFHDAECDDSASGLDFLPAARLSKLASEDFYSWGDFRFADFTGDAFPMLSPDEIAELLYFGHIGQPLRRNRIGTLGNCFLVAIHDDGWCIQVRYSDWSDVDRLLQNVGPGLSPELVARIEEGGRALWIRGGRVAEEERTLDIDSVLNRRL